MGQVSKRSVKRAKVAGGAGADDRVKGQVRLVMHGQIEYREKAEDAWGKLCHGFKYIKYSCTDLRSVPAVFLDEIREQVYRQTSLNGEYGKLEKSQKSIRLKLI